MQYPAIFPIDNPFGGHIQKDVCPNMGPKVAV